MFNKRLRAIRMQKGLTQQKMANYLNIELRSYQKYEQGKRSPSLNNLVTIADIFDVSLDYLLCRDDFIQSHATSSDEC